MSAIKWYKRDPNAALGGLMGLTLEERGAYCTVLDLIYSHDGNLIDDDKFICGWLQCDPRVWKRIKARLLDLAKIELKGGLVTNFRATSEITEALGRVVDASELGRINGIKSGIARRKNKELGEPTLEGSANTPTPTPRIEEEKISLEGRKATVAGTIPLDENDPRFKTLEAAHRNKSGKSYPRTTVRINGKPCSGWYFTLEQIQGQEQAA